MSEIEYTSSKYRTHNGTLTINNPVTQDHRTFKIRTQADDASFAPGARVVSLLVGPEDWQSFGFAGEDGVRVWRKKQGGVFDTYAKMIARPEDWQARGLEYHLEGACRVCNRPLTNPVSIESGIGPVCAGRS